MLKICLTGGPCAGKSSIMSKLVQLLEERGYKTLICPETATELILNGIVPWHIPAIDFQELVLDKQLAKEELYDKAAKYYDDKLVIIYDRGLLDQLAYLSREEFEILLKKKNLSFAEAMNHYDCVCHLVTAADGAEEFYQWNDPSKEDNGNNAARSESPEEAKEKDKLTLNAWTGHPHLRVFDNSTNFEGKINRVINEIFSLLGIPVPTEIERKFLIKMPTKKELESLGCVSINNIIQTYLNEVEDGVERRVRQRGTKQDGFSFYYTEKKEIGKGERMEVERKITPEEYISYLSETDTSLHQISKIRHCFIFDTKYYEMDFYPFSDEYAILEIELNDINEEINLPPLTFVKEVTDDVSYKNHSLARILSFNL